MVEEGSNRRIVKNTIFLYFRSFLMMAVNLYSSRVILQALGVDDYGLYGVIGSIVAMFTIINGVLAAGTSRFLTFELGKGEKEKLQKTFSASFAMHVGLAVILFVLLETIGLWFVNCKMNIPEGREFAANIVYQLSIITCMFSLTQVPYNASIIAHEKMDIYAYVGIAEAIFKLVLVTFLLYVPTTDNLIAYAIILAVWSIGLQVFYRVYCYKRFPESHISVCRDKAIYKGMLSYSMWDFVGQFCAQGNSEGLNILINMFFGVSLNAGRTIAYQAENAILQFANNFMTSVQPQIVKNYAQGNYDRFFQLIFESGRLSFFLLYLISLPIFLESDYILKLWLKDVPDSALMFFRFAIAYQLFRIPMRATVQGIHATGNIKYLNLTSGCYSAGTFLLANYVAYRLGAPVWVCFVVQSVNGIVLTYFEMNSLYRNIPFSRLKFIKRVFLSSFFIAVISSFPAILSVCFLEQSFFRLIITGLLSVLTISTSVFYFGISKEMQYKILTIIKSKFNR